MLTTEVCVADWAACTPGRATKADWRRWAGASDAAVAGSPAGTAPVMPMMLRRRLGRLGQMAIGAAFDAGAEGARYVFCSRHGDFARTLGLLRAVALREPLSPAEFSVSVHNALVGLLSIATKATAGHTAIAAGPDSFAFGLMEAAGSLAENPDEPVLLVYCDERLPAPCDEVDQDPAEALALALRLVPAARPAASGDIVTLSIERGEGSVGATTGQALDTVRFLASGEARRRSTGARVTVEWRRAG